MSEVTRIKLKCELCRGRLVMSKGEISGSAEMFGQPIPYVSFTCQNPECEQSHCYGFLGHTYTVATFGGTWRDTWRELATDNAMRFVGGLRTRREFWRERVKIWYSLVKFLIGPRRDAANNEIR